MLDFSLSLEEGTGVWTAEMKLTRADTEEKLATVVMEKLDLPADWLKEGKFLEISNAEFGTYPADPASLLSIDSLNITFE